MAQEKRTLSVEEINDIENIIGYTFKNKALLEQAFTRSSFANENKDAVSNEVLEFYGDRALDLVVTIALSKTYGDIENGQYVTKIGNGVATEINEGFLSNVKRSLVNKDNLASRVEELGLAKYLLVGNNDDQANVRYVKSVKEDLFEAICGAMAIETNWNFGEITDVILKMLDFTTLYQEATNANSQRAAAFFAWYFKHYGKLPEFEVEVYEHLIRAEDDACVRFRMENRNNQHVLEHEIYSQNIEKAKNELAVWFYEQLFFEGEVFEFFPDEYRSLFRESWLEPNLDNAINILQEMEQAKLLKEVNYTFEADGNDENGNPLWAGKLHVEINSPFDEKATNEVGHGGFKSKTDCKKRLALAALESIYDYFNVKAKLSDLS